MADVIDRAPAVPGALAVCTTGLTAAYAGPGAAISVLIVLVAVAAAVAGGGFRTRRRLWIAVAIAVSLRVVAAVDGERRAARIWSERAASGVTIEMIAVVRATSVHASGSGRWRIAGVAEACSVEACRGARLRWSWRGPDAPSPGERWTLAGRLIALPGPAGFGHRFPPSDLGPRARRGEIEDPHVEARRASGTPLLRTTERHLRDRIAARFGESDAPLLVALLLGDRSAIDPELYDAFAVAGALHLLAVSGLHVGFLAWLMATALRTMGLGPIRRASAATVLLAAYALLVGARPSVVRAAIMLIALLWSGALERRVSVWHLWGVAAAAILAWRPLDLFDLGFALSFGAVAGLLAWGGPLSRLISIRTGGPWVSAARLLWAGLVATTAASLGTLPIQSLSFGWLAPAGFLVNPFIVPIAAVALPLAWATLGVDAIGLDFLAGPLAATVSTAIGVIRSIVVEAGARSSPWIPGVPARVLLPVTVAALAARGIAVRAAAPWGVAAIIATLSLPSPPVGEMEIVWLDVGQGDAIVVHFPDGATWLIDAGPAWPGGDAGRSVIAPYLLRRGVSRLEWLITTHPDLDHIGGAVSVAGAIPVGRWGSPGAISVGPAYLELLARTGLRAVRLGAGDRLRQGGVTVTVLHPTPGWVRDDPETLDGSANEGSLVLRIEHGACVALLTGDVGEVVERMLIVGAPEELRADLLHVGHHGSRHSTTQPFIEHVAPEVAVISVGRFNRHGHPSAEVLARLEGSGADVLRTDRVGSVRARCGEEGWRMESGGPYLR